MKYIIPLFMLLILASSALATAPANGNLMTVYCDGSAGTDTFNEGEEVCIYGVGYDANTDIDIILENETEVVETSTESTNENGIISLRSIWSNIKAGVYNFFADLNNNKEQDDNEESQSLFVIGEQLSEDEQPVEEVPEFGTIAAFFVLLGAGIFIYRKREAQ